MLGGNYSRGPQITFDGFDCGIWGSGVTNEDLHGLSRFQPDLVGRFELSDDELVSVERQASKSFVVSQVMGMRSKPEPSQRRAWWAAWTNAFILRGSFLPGAISTPLAVSTASGRTD